MTYEPATLSALQEYLHDQTGLSHAALGVVGDRTHRGGYHCGWDRRSKNSRGDLADYSWEDSSRDSRRKTNAASAIDIGSFDDLRAFSLWLVKQCREGTADTRDIREVIYSPDGRKVKRWDRLDQSSTGDASHRWHTHVSFFRDAENRDKLAVFRRWFEGGKAPAAPPAGNRPAPGPNVAFPLPSSSFYFGPKSGDRYSVSGFYGRRFNGKTDSEWLQLWVRQLDRRGWSVGKGKTYLRRFGNDGRYGDEYRRLIKAFQADQGLKQDGLLGPVTWAAAFTNPVTG
ncbi:peptidoglycan-binding protein [Glycomyces sp. A-F 0318]|uniref:peptidoglycan-binding domain-containing protein n=1 Tax=Glycomyces amatae TaxID=2881355 RepID=UPI001E587F6C|nr:peptidoglycan-binding protein [Glycomyces amatae]